MVNRLPTIRGRNQAQTRHGDPEYLTICRYVLDNEAPHGFPGTCRDGHLSTPIPAASMR